MIIGDINGNIEIYDIDFENKTYKKKFFCDANFKYHLSKIIFLDWLKIKINDKMKLSFVSCCEEGKFFIWDISNKLEFPKIRYIIKIKNNNLQIKNKYNLVISSIFTKKEKPGIFFLGTKAGNFGFIEIDRFIKDHSIKIANQKKFEKSSLDFLKNIQKKYLIEIIMELQNNVKKESKYSIDDIFNNFNFDKIYENLILTKKNNLIYNKIFILDMNFRKNVLMNENKKDLVLFNLKNNSVLQKFEFSNDLKNAKFVSFYERKFVVLLETKEFYIYEFNDHSYEIDFIVNNVIFFEIVSQNEQTLLLLLKNNDEFEILSLN